MIQSRNCDENVPATISTLGSAAALRLAHLRLAAAATVAAAHCVQICLYPVIGHQHPAAQAAGFAASIAVGLFFCISGFLIAHSIAARIVAPGRGFDWQGYLRARARRILPPFLFAVALTVLVVVLIRGAGLYGAETYLLPGDKESFRPSASVSLREVLWTLTLSYNLIPGHGSLLTLNGPLWSLSFEVWLYAAALFWGIGYGGSRLWGYAAAFAVVAVPVGLDNRLFTIFAALWLLAFASPRLWHAPGRSARPVALLAGWWLAAVVLLASMVPEVRAMLVAPYGRWPANLLFIGNVLAIGCLLMAFYVRPATAGAGAPGAAPRDYSYTLYVTHFPLLALGFSLFRPLLDPRSVPQMAGLAAALFLAVLAFSAMIGPRLEMAAARSRIKATVPRP
jgi:peptidoglycan/LPS O-acetylase OafA/YrhL